MEKIDNKIKYEGELDLNGLKIPCYVLEDGRRVLSTTGMQKALKITSGDSSDRSATRLAQMLSAKNLNRCVPSIVYFFHRISLTVNTLIGVRYSAKVRRIFHIRKDVWYYT